MSESFDCTQARHILESSHYESDRPGQNLRSRQHVEACADCQRFFKKDLAMRERLTLLSAQQAPAGLRDSVLKAIKQEATVAARRTPALASRLKRPAVIVAMAAVLSFLIIRAFPVTPPPDGPILISAVQIWKASDEISNKTNPQDLEAWFSSNFDTHVMVPEIDGGRLLGGGIGNFYGHRSATVAYDFDGTPLTYMIVRSSYLLGRSVSHGDGPHFINKSAENENAVLWGAHNTARLLVGALPPDKLMSIAEKCRRQDLSES